MKLNMHEFNLKLLISTERRGQASNFIVMRSLTGNISGQIVLSDQFEPRLLVESSKMDQWLSSFGLLG